MNSSILTGQPLWLIAELTYQCPLQCTYCSNPLQYQNLEEQKPALTTEQWIDLLCQARKLGAVQLGLTGGEPALRKDLELIIAKASKLGFYTNLITSGVGLNESRLNKMKQVGLDSIQLSFQGIDAQSSQDFSNKDHHEHKVTIAKLIKKLGYPLSLNFVLHKGNIEKTKEILELSLDLQADYIELANTQYYGWAELNKQHLMPSLAQIKSSNEVAKQYQKQQSRMKIYYVEPDYHNNTPKPCVNKWGTTMMLITPTGNVLPCHNAINLPSFEFPNIKTDTLEDIWRNSDIFNRFRGTDWMQEPCSSCEHKHQDHGGCRCQAYMLTKDMYATDPVCIHSPHHKTVEQTVLLAQLEASLTNPKKSQPVYFRNRDNSRKLAASPS